jgi:tetratricopeptide (TPR) repeat protein
LTLAGQLRAAVREYERALALNPDYAQAHNNLGGALTRLNRVDEAIPHLEAALALEPANALAHYNMGVAMRERGDFAQAIAHFKRAAERNGDWTLALSDLAWLLAVSPQDSLREPPLSIALAEHVAELTGRRDPVALDVLAAAYGAAGQFGRAEAAAAEALALNPANADAIRTRRAGYAEGRPYRLPAR